VPEEVEVETEDETLHEAIEREGISLLKATALTTAACDPGSSCFS